MSEIRDYMTEKMAAGEKEGLRREPRATHQEILALVREALAAGLFYDDDVERFVNERTGDLPPHVRHGADGREPLVYQLGHEAYIAKGIIRDEERAAEIEAARAAGFEFREAAQLVAGARCLIRCGTLYSGSEVPEFGAPRAVRLEQAAGGRWGFIPKGARTIYALPDHALIRAGWEVAA